MSCSFCSLKSECLKNKGENIYVYNSLKAKIGDIVELEIEEKMKWIFIFLFFVFPVVLLFTGIILGERKNELIGFSLGILLVSIYYLSLLLLEKRIKLKKGIIKMVKILDENKKNDQILGDI